MTGLVATAARWPPVADCPVKPLPGSATGLAEGIDEATPGLQETLPASGPSVEVRRVAARAAAER